MTETVPSEQDEARFLVMGAFGETVMRFQLLEMTFWSILALRLKKGVTLDQGMAKVASWDAQTMGRLVGVLDLPDELKAEADTAVDTRNYLVHRFMRDRAPYLHDVDFCHHVADELAKVLARLDDFEERLDAHTRGLGLEVLTDEDLERMGLAEPPDPAVWFEGFEGPDDAS
ncbi:hypothetical protein LWC35_18155 [Pseudonocardia kujensis]|uniref:hypothetical protein n=1 Tax=Pseudonocardia kujensis TaxID=1128675 RepID=UPI001E3DBFFF|nr:hypothetical protein [Pseudonocardia kujensis]MCE0764815.1 hypothetical protein [Pseudonocardia kujensis]